MTTYLKNYKPTNFSIESVNLEFNIQDELVTVTNIMQFKRKSSGALSLAGDDLSLVSLHMDSEPLTEQDYTIEGDDLVLDNLADEFELKVVTNLLPHKNTQLAGLFKTNSIYCTQCESHGFRRITYFYDRPDVLSTYTTRIIADKDKYPVLLSNGNLIESGDIDDKRHFAVWQDPFKKPAYLFALVAGALLHITDTFVTKSGKSVDLRIYVEPKDIQKCEHAMQSLKKAMRWDEEVYGLEYDLSTFMIVAVSDFNMGAMENKGLNIFNSKYILATKASATDKDYAGIEGVVAHEYFHNWTGNRVTCRDWFQLSLKEGLTVFRDQEFSRDMNSRAVNRIQDVRILRAHQFPEDAGSMAHPVRPTAYQEVNNFYTTTIYNKGAEVIRMQHTLLGQSGFRKGMDLYFKRHDGAAVTIDDFVKAMEDANSKDLTQFKYWYDKAGTPVVEVKTQFADNKLTLTFKQSCRKTPETKEVKPFHIPIRFALFKEDGSQIDVGQDLLEIKEFTQSFEFAGLEAKPVVSLLRDFSAPIYLKTDNSEKDMQAILKFETDGFAKWDAAQTLAKQYLVASYASRDKLTPPDSLLDAYKHILTDTSLDKALQAEILTLPSFEDLANEISEIDVIRAEDIRDDFRKSLAVHLYADAKRVYDNLWGLEEHSMQSQAYGARNLRNICLQYIFYAEQQVGITLCKDQFQASETMTDKLASLNLLVSSNNSAARNSALDNFYQEWAGDGLVIDKWFTAQASAKVPGVLADIKVLLKHPDFKLTNPNRVRSLIVSFCQFNPRYFHAADGSGYQLLTDIILEVDKINPQLSSRIATPYTRWQRLDKPRQDLIRAELQKLDSHKISVDLREMVARGLDA